MFEVVVYASRWPLPLSSATTSARNPDSRTTAWRLELWTQRVTSSVFFKSSLPIAAPSFCGVSFRLLCDFGCFTCRTPEGGA